MLFKRFRNKEKTAKAEVAFIGRNQQAVSAYRLLGGEVRESRIQYAIGSDYRERAELLSQIETIEENSVSDLALNYAPSSLDVHTRTLNIMSDGYKTCVLQNDPALENRCLNLRERARIRVL